MGARFMTTNMNNTIYEVNYETVSIRNNII
jgi:hypothetical protein